MSNRAKGEIKGLLTSGALDGIEHLAGSSHIIFKIFWSGVVLAGVILGAIVINSAYTDWEENPTETIIQTFSHPVQDIQFPTVTVCPNFDFDRWGYLKQYLNAVKFKCDDDDDCSQTEAVRRDFATFLDLYKNHVMGQLNKKLDIFSIDAYLVEHVAIALFAKINGSSLSQFETEMTQHVGDMVLQKRERAIIIELGIDEAIFEKNNAGSRGPMPSKPVYFSEEQALLVEKFAKMISFLIVMPSPGGLGTLLANYATQLVGGSFDQSQTELLESIYSVTFTQTEVELHEAFVHILNDVLDGGNEFNISMIDLPAIMAPVSLISYSPKWSTKFKYTMAQHPTDFYKILYGIGGSYFGPFLSKHSDTLMRVLQESAFQAKRSDAKLKSLYLNSTLINRYPLADALLQSREIAPGNMFTWCAHLGGTCEFNPVLGDEGICVAFNNYPMRKAFKPSPMLDSFLTIYETNEKEDIINNPGSGKAFVMELLLNGQQSWRDYRQSGSFVINFNHLFDFFDTRNGGYEIHIGYKTHILITPTQHITSEDFRDLPLETRKCRYLNENPKEDSIFAFYTQKSCIFECNLENGYEKFENCTPWNFPRKEGWSVCDGRQSHWFKFYMNHQDTMKHCECLPDCEEVVFDHSINSQVRMLPEIECQYYEVEKITNPFAHSVRNLETVDGEDFFWRMRQLERNESFSLSNIVSFIQNTKPLEDLRKICSEAIAKDCCCLNRD